MNNYTTAFLLLWMSHACADMNATQNGDCQSSPEILRDMFNAKNDPGFYFCADYLYWIAHEDGLEFVLNGIAYDSTLTSPPSLTYTGKTFLPDFEWDSGFKVGFGYVNECNVWDFFGNWTWYQTDAEGRARAASGSFFDSSQLYSQFTIARYGLPNLEAASAKWELDYNTLDVSVGRNFSVGDYFSWKPFSGLRAAWIDQEYKLHNIGFPIVTARLNEERVNNKLDYRAVGFRGGFQTSWWFNQSFSFFSDTSFSVLYGRLDDLYEEIRSTGFNGAIDQTVAKVRNTIHSTKTEVELAIGFRYETACRNDRFNLAFEAAWEYMNWINMNQFYIPITGIDPYHGEVPTNPYQPSGQFERMNGDLGITGLRISAKLGF